MIPSYRWPLFSRWFSGRVQAQLRSGFSRVRVRGLDQARVATRDRSTLWVANHTSWWDPMVAIALGEWLELETYAMMAQEHLERLAFFGLVGAFGVRRGHRRDGAEVTRYAASLLARRGRAVWIFPQGDVRPASEALRFAGGAASIHRRAPGTSVIPVGLRYVLGDDPRPELWISIGPPCDGPETGAAGTAVLEAAVASCLRAIDEVPGEFTLRWAPRATGGFGTRMLSGFARWVVRLFGGRLQAAVGTDSQRAIGPAHAAAETDPREHGEQHEIGEPRVEQQARSDS